jgi:hypothetical protein
LCESDNNVLAVFVVDDPEDWIKIDPENEDVEFELTSNNGRPAALVTENKDPAVESVILNNVPVDPCMLNIGLADPDPLRVNTVAPLDCDITVDPVTDRVVPE